MNAASAGWDMACRMLGVCRFGFPIDSEFGDGVAGPGGAANWTGPKQFTYARYDPDVTAEGLRALGLADVHPEHVQLMDSVEFVGDILRVGQTFAAKVSLDHLVPFV
jgi:hypothetical protein